VRVVTSKPCSQERRVRLAAALVRPKAASKARSASSSASSSSSSAAGAAAPWTALLTESGKHARRVVFWLAHCLGPGSPLLERMRMKGPLLSRTWRRVVAVLAVLVKAAAARPTKAS